MLYDGGPRTTNDGTRYNPTLLNYTGPKTPYSLGVVIENNAAGTELKVRVSTSAQTGNIMFGYWDEDAGTNGEHRHVISSATFTFLDRGTQIAGIDTRLGSLETSTQGLAALETRIESLETSTQGLAALETRIESLETSTQGLAALETRIESLETSTQGLAALETRIESLEARIRAMETASDSGEDSDSSNESSAVSLLIDKEAQSAVLIYPNPALRQLQVANLDPARHYTYLIYTATGEELRKSSLGPSRLINLDTLPSGQYIFLLRDEAGSQTLKSVLIVL